MADHVIVVGSGLAGYGVLRELRKLSPEAKLTLVTLDDGHFYSKPALSTAFAKGKTSESLITSPAEKMAAQLNFELRSKCTAEAIDRSTKMLLTNQGPVPYDKLILALGADPIRPQIGGNAAERAFAVNNLDQYRSFCETLSEGARVLILGAGLVGTEFANDLVGAGYRPKVIDMLGYPLAQLVPRGVGEMVRDALAMQGVEWHFGRKVVAINRTEAGVSARLDDDSIVEAEAILSAVGLRPHTALAERAGIEIGRGIKVDTTGLTNDPHIYAIGDCAEYPQGLAAYITPIMAAARAIAASALGSPTDIRFPVLSVQVKTSAYPIVLLPAPPNVPGGWEKDADETHGLKYLFRDQQGAVRGYVLTRERSSERADLDRELASLV